MPALRLVLAVVVASGCVTVTTPNAPLTPIPQPTTVAVVRTIPPLPVASARVVSYDDLYRRPDDYVGELLYFPTVAVVGEMSAFAGWEPDSLLVAPGTERFSTDWMVLLGWQGERLREGDVLEVTARMQGLREYLTEIPLLQIVSARRLPPG